MENSDKKESKRIKQEANLFDKIFKEVSDWPMINFLFKRWGKKIEKWTYVKTKMQTTYEREIDTAYLITSDSVEMLVHLEYQSSNDPEMIYRMFEYFAMLTRRFPDKVIRSTVIYVGDDKPTMATKLKPEQIFTGFDLVNIKSLNFEEMLEAEDAQSILHTILADFPKEQGEEIICRIVAKLKKKCKSQAELIQRCRQLQVFSFLRNLGVVTNKILKNMSIHIDLSSNELFIDTFRPKVLEFERRLKEAEAKVRAEALAKAKLKAELKAKLEAEAKLKTKVKLDAEKARLNLHATISRLLKLDVLSEQQIAEATGADLQLIRQIKNEIC